MMNWSRKEFKGSEMTKYVKSFEALKPNTMGFVEKGLFVKMFVEAHEKARSIVLSVLVPTNSSISYRNKEPVARIFRHFL